MNRAESKYFHTAVKMDEAFLALLEQKELPYITVKELCEKAGVNRSTFYLHYETVADLLEESMDYMTGQFLTHMDREPADFISQLSSRPLEELYLLTPEYLLPYLRYIKAHRRLFRTAMENSSALHLDRAYSRLFQHILTPILSRYQVPPQNQSYLVAFHIHGLMAIITQWLKEDCDDPEEDIVAIMQYCIPKKRPGNLQS